MKLYSVVSSCTVSGRFGGIIVHIAVHMLETADACAPDLEHPAEHCLSLYCTAVHCTLVLYCTVLFSAVSGDAPSALFVDREGQRSPSGSLARYMASVVPNAKLEVIPLAGHLPHLTHPKLVAEVIEKHADM